MQAFYLEQTVDLLNQILSIHLAEVLRYTQYSLLASGYDKLSIANLFTELASESLRQAQAIGKILTAMNEQPKLAIPSFGEPMQQSVQEMSTQEMLLRSLHQERQALALNRALLQSTQKLNYHLEQLAGSMLLHTEAKTRKLTHQLNEQEVSVCLSLSA